MVAGVRATRSSSRHVVTEKRGRTMAADRGCSLEAVGLAFVIGGLAGAAVASVVGAAVGS